jgi:hypothetical protein
MFDAVFREKKNSFELHDFTSFFYWDLTQSCHNYVFNFSLSCDVKNVNLKRSKLDSEERDVIEMTDNEETVDEDMSKMSVWITLEEVRCMKIVVNVDVNI